jgi:hypothetical protein
MAVEIWIIVWQDAGLRYYFALNSTKPLHTYKVSRNNTWKFPPPDGRFNDNIIITSTPNAIEEPVIDEEFEDPEGGTIEVNVTIVSKYPEVTIKWALLWFRVRYKDGTDTKWTTSANVPFKSINTTHLYAIIPKFPARIEEGRVYFYVKAWDVAEQILTSEADPEDDAIGPKDPYSYRIPPAPDPGMRNVTFFFVSVYDGGKTPRYQKGVNVTFENESGIICETQTDDTGFCYPHEEGSRQIIWLDYHQNITITIEYEIEKGMVIRSEFVYYLDDELHGNRTIMRSEKGEIFFIKVYEYDAGGGPVRTIEWRFNWRPEKVPPVYAGTIEFPQLHHWITYVVCLGLLGPTIWWFDRRRKKAEEEEKRITL